MGIEQKQTFRLTCDRHGCKTSIEYDSWSEVEKVGITTDNGSTEIWNSRFGCFKDLPEDWDYKYYSGYGSKGTYHFYCPDCVKQIKEEEIRQKENADRNRAQILRKQERYNRVIGK